MKRFRNVSIITFAFIFFTIITIFADNPNQWKYSKEVHYENKEEVKAIYLDEQIYKYANEDLSDIRLVNKKNEFIPYYIYNKFVNTNEVAYVEYESQKVLSFMKKNDYYVDFAINATKENVDVIGNQLKLEVAKDTFFKEIQILGSYDNKNWENVKTDIIYSINGLTQTEIPLGNAYKYIYYRIISVNDTTGVPIDHVSLVYDHTESIPKEYKQLKVVNHEVAIDKEKKETIVKIHNTDRLRINNIQIISNDDFNRSYELYTVNKNGEKLAQVRAGEIYRLHLEQFKAENTNIPIKETIRDFVASEYLHIVIHDRDDYPINIENVEISYCVDKVVFKTNDPSGIHILFGNKEAQKPHYDVSTYMKEIETTKQESTVLSDLIERDIEQTASEKNFDFQWILNICVMAISGFLVVLISRKKL